MLFHEIRTLSYVLSSTLEDRSSWKSWLVWFRPMTDIVLIQWISNFKTSRIGIVVWTRDFSICNLRMFIHIWRIYALFFILLYTEFNNSYRLEDYQNLKIIINISTKKSTNFYSREKKNTFLCDFWSHVITFYFLVNVLCLLVQSSSLYHCFYNF